MHQKKIRLAVIEAALFLSAAVLIWRLSLIIRNEETITASTQQGRYSMSVCLSTGTIYDCNFRRITNNTPVLYGIVNPTADAIASIFRHIEPTTDLTEQIKRHSPFCCLLQSRPDTDNVNVRIYQGYQNAGVQYAQHIVGYRQNGIGVAGLEAAYGDWLKSCDRTVSLTFPVNAVGAALTGIDTQTDISGYDGGGLVTTLDKSIQEIIEAALQSAKPNPSCAIVLDVKSGAILGMASQPCYDTAHLAEALHDEYTPFLNRALCAYPVGSVFKLAVAVSALENGLSQDYMYECTGQTDVYGQHFRCHDLEGHGIINLRGALIGSCNPYFINLTQLLSAQQLHDTAESFGFGKSIPLAKGINAAAGYLQTESELSIEAEKANFSFGQGKLLASPLHIAAMTACIADQGCYHTPYLVRGLTENGSEIIAETSVKSKQIMKHETAAILREMMCGVLSEGKSQNGIPQYTTAGGKTSTAQTGYFLDDGTECCHAWMTGFFPANSPEYAVTVFVENGGSGNQAAAPIFREIIDHIAVMDSN